jgi:hypothetical protein
MRRTSLLLVVFALNFGLVFVKWVVASPEEDVTACELVTHPTAHLNKVVFVTGKMLFSRFSDTVLAGCPLKDSPPLVVLDPGYEATPHVDFLEEPGTLEAIQPFLLTVRSKGKSPTIASACGKFSGQMFYQKDFHSGAPGTGQANGFGPTKIYRFAFVLKSVLQIASCR